MFEIDITTLLWGNFFQGGPAMGLILNIVISITAIFFGALIGIPIGLGRVILPYWTIAPITLFLSIIRATPLLLLILWLFILIQVLLNSSLEPLWIGCIGLSLYAMTHLSDLVRAGAKSVAKEQIDAARSLGLNELQVARFILSPIALRTMFPAFCSFFTSLFKDSSICYVIGVIELMQLGVLESTRNPTNIIQNYFVIALIFLVVSMSGTRLGYKLEKKINIKGMHH